MAKTVVLAGPALTMGAGTTVRSASTAQRALAGAETAASGVAEYAEGTFSITRYGWKGYPTRVPMPPEGTTFRLLQKGSAEYTGARSAAYRINDKLRSALGLRGRAVDIHEIIPVKFGGSPTSLANKWLLESAYHDKYVTTWWRAIQHTIERKF